MWTACGMGGFGWLSVLLLLVLGVGALARFWPLTPRTDSSMTLLRERYARGDVTREEFEVMRADLESPHRTSGL